MRTHIFSFLLLGFTNLLFFPAHAANLDSDSTIIARTSIPSWVKISEIDPDAETPQDGISGGIWYLLSDTQTHVEKSQRYGHYAYRFLNPTGLSDRAQLSFSYDPVYQNFSLHRLTVHRNGAALDRLNQVEIRIIDSESGHERQLYDGSKRALIILKDIRVGDVLEYAYSIRGNNPVFGDHHCSFHSLGFSTTIGKIHRRVLWNPEKRTIQHKMFNTQRPPKIQQLGELKEIIWEIKDSPLHKRDSSTPSWHVTAPLLQLSDFSSWKDFSTWATPLFKNNSTLPKALKDECERISKLPSDSKRVMAALRYVQDNIRYLGSFMGQHTHKPYSLETILDRRFGDCKDKSAMLCAMLKELGYDAVPAFVDTSETKATKHYLPGYYNFDHAITCLRLNGENYWLDGTAGEQGGSLANLSTPAYGYAFVVDGNSKSLNPVKPRGLNTRKTSVTEHYTAPDLSGTIQLRVTTTATGEDAVGYRQYFASNSIEKITEDYQKFYSSAYPDITAKRVTFKDDRAANIFVIKENYTITSFWKESDSSTNMLEGWFQAQSTYQKIDKPSSPLRTMPYSIYHPVNFHQTVIIDMPEDWNFSPLDEHIENEAFKFTTTSQVNQRSIEIRYHFRTKQDFVSMKSLKKYIANCEDAENATYYQVSFPKSLAGGEGDSSSSTMDVILVIAILGAGVFGLIMAVLTYFYDPKPKNPVEPVYLQGLSGWLVLVAIRLCLAPLILLFSFMDIGDTLDGGTLAALVESKMHTNLVTIFTAYTTTALLIPLHVLLIVLFFKKRSSFPRLFVGVILLSLVTDFITIELLKNCEGVAQSDISEGNFELVRFCIYAAIWVPYMLVSKRVKNTFRVTRKPQTNSTPPVLPPTLPPAAQGTNI